MTSVSKKPIPKKRRKIVSLDKKKARTGWLFVLPFAIGFVLAFVLLLFLNPIIVPVFVLTGRGFGALCVAVTVYHFYPSKLALLCAFGITVVGAIIIRGVIPMARGSERG